MREKNPEKEEEWTEDSDSSEEEMDVQPEVEAEENGSNINGEACEPAGDEDNSGKSSEDDSSSDSDSDDSLKGQASGSGVSGVSENKEEESEVDEDDPVIRAITLGKKKKESNHPPDLVLNKSTPSSLCFHQTEDILAICTFEGDLKLYSYSNKENNLVQSVNNEQIAREVTYSMDGEKILIAHASRDLFVYDVRNGLTLERCITQATHAPVSSLYSIDEHTFATGDDDGYVMLWDNRSQKSVATLKLGEDCVSSMITNSEKRLLICATTEGAIYSLKIHGGKILTESEIYDYEFNCLGLFKQESKLAVGSGNGDVYVFNWNEFGKHSDIYTKIGKKQSINALVPITERIIITGGEDGCIRAVNFFPQKYLGVVGKVPYSIEKMDVCNDGHLIATVGQDEEVVKFWNVEYFEGMAVSTEEKMKKNLAKPPKDEGSRANLPSSSNQNSKDFYSGLE